MSDYYVWVKWDPSSTVWNAEYDLFDDEDAAEAKWNATTVTGSEKCACWEVTAAGNYDYIQDQAHSYLWK